jgi:hypothetical protein
MLTSLLVQTSANGLGHAVPSTRPTQRSGYSVVTIGAYCAPRAHRGFVLQGGPGMLVEDSLRVPTRRRC